MARRERIATLTGAGDRLMPRTLPFDRDGTPLARRMDTSPWHWIVSRNWSITDPQACPCINTPAHYHRM